MAAGLGFKDFTTGEVLTAADVDGYLMQGIWVFASAAARDAAVTSPQEGNACYLKDTNEVLTYSGSAWVAVGGASATFVGVRLTKSANQSISNSTTTAVTFDGETYDTDAFHDNSTNNTRITIPSGKDGYYLIYGAVSWGINATGRREYKLLKNGVLFTEGGTGPTSGASVSNIFSIVLNLAAADYIELGGFQTTGGAFDVQSTASMGTTFGVVKLG
jgi:predicted flavoprotein YhiN